MFATTAMLCLAMLAPDETIFSGPQPGEALSPFDIVSGFGPTRGDVLTVAKETQKPQVVMFMHEKSRPAFGLTIATAKLAADRKEALNLAFVFLTEDPNEGSQWLGNIQQHFPAGVTGGVFEKGVEGPEAYGLNRNVTLTVLVAKEGKVTANFALVQPSLQVDGPKIFAAIGTALGEQKAPQISDYSGRGMQARGDMRRAPDLRTLLRPMLDKDATKDQIDEAAAKIVATSKRFPAFRQQVGTAAGRIVSSGNIARYGNEFTQAWIRKWAEEFKAAPGSDRGESGAKGGTTDQPRRQRDAQPKRDSVDRSA